MNIELSSSDSDRAHRIDRKKESNRKGRAVTVKIEVITQENTFFFSNMKQLKSTDVFITKNLMAKRMETLKEAKEKHHFTNVLNTDS